MSPETVILRHLARLREIAPAGFAIALHIRFTAPTYMFQAYPDAWLEEYGREGLVMFDPSVAWAFAHTGTVSWADLVTSDEARIFARAAQHGLVHGFTVSLLRGDTQSMAGFARPDRDFTQEEIVEAEAAVTLMHDATLPGQALGPEMQDELRRMSVTSTHP